MILRGSRLAGVHDRFKVLQTTERSQIAVMNLAAGEVSGELGNDHPQSDQILMVLEGGGSVRIGDEEFELNPGDVAVIPAGAPHQVRGPNRTISFYAPVAYPEEA